MSNIIPPLLSDTPPPPPDNDEHEDDEFGDFTGPNNLSYDYDDSVSPPGSPLQLPTEQFEFDDHLPSKIYDINSNSKENMVADSSQLDRAKDFCDKRKHLESDNCFSEITEHCVDDKLHTALNVTAPASIFEDHNLLDENQEQSEQKNNEKLNEIIETNCDIKTTSCQQEINIRGTSKTDSVTGVKNTDISCEDSNIIATTSSRNFADIIVNCESNSGANSVHNSLELGLNNDTVAATQLSEQFDTFSNKTLNIGDNDSTAKQLENTLISPNRPETINNSLLNICENGFEIDEFSMPQDEEMFNVEGQPETTKKIEGQQNCVSSLACAEEMSNNEDHEVAVPILNNACLDDNEFGAFIANSVDVQNSTCSDNITKNDLEVSFEEAKGKTITKFDNDDFGGFATIDTAQSAATFNDNFASFPHTSQNFSDEDDFGDFTTTFASHENPAPKQDGYDKILLLSEKHALDKSREIIKEMFPPPESSVADFEFRGLEENDEIFDQIKNITETHALSFQWAKSASQNLLLMALNIDSRNILYGPSWNASVPRFAANLSFTPLEPVKSEILTPTPVKEVNTSKPAQSTATGDALHFNSRELGLADPLEYLEQLVAKLEIPSVKGTSVSHNSSSPASEFENWEAWLQSIPDKEPNIATTKESPSVAASKRENPVPTLKHDDFDSFVSYSAPSVQENSHGHNIVLRETHISNKEVRLEQDIVNWLEPTIVTPELSRKERSFVEADDEFDDFQVVAMPEDHSGKSAAHQHPEVLQPQAAAKTKEAKDSSTVNDDDFGDFTFSLPADTASATPISSVPLLEPLKPSVVQPQNVSSISWPAPGVTEEQISRFEALGYSRLQGAKELTGSDASILPNNSTITAKQSSLDDEEWSDFVSVQNPSPVHKLKAEKERSSTPDLPLSVLNLGNIQPAKQPIPVITPNGLVQTKLSSNVTLINFPNMAQQANRGYTQPHNNPLHQPSIISNQYATQAYGGFNHYQAHQKPAPSADDDEWSDFVSHQPTQQNQSSNWLNAAPNIITNPAAAGFDVLGGSSVQKRTNKRFDAAQNRKGNGVPCVSIPELDFLAPRNRTIQRK